MTRFPNTSNPPEELDGLRVLWAILIMMTLGDICFLWNSYSYSVGDDAMAVFMTASTMAGIVGLPMLAAWSLGAALDHAENGKAARFHTAVCVASLVMTVAVIVFVTVLRMGTVGVTEGGAGSFSSGAASFGQSAVAQQVSEQGSGTGSLLVMLMTVLLASTAVLSFARRLIDCSMTLREPMIQSYRQRTAPKRVAQIDAVIAGIQARSVEVQRADDERLHGAALAMAAKTAGEIVIDLEKEVAIASEDPASWQVAMGDHDDAAEVGQQQVSSDAAGCHLDAEAEPEREEPDSRKRHSDRKVA